jgi:hypothetical protein
VAGCQCTHACSSATTLRLSADNHRTRQWTLGGLDGALRELAPSLHTKDTSEKAFVLQTRAQTGLFEQLHSIAGVR